MAATELGRPYAKRRLPPEVISALDVLAAWGKEVLVAGGTSPDAAAFHAGTTLDGLIGDFRRAAANTRRRRREEERLWAPYRARAQAADEARLTLGVTPSDDDATIKSAYRMRAFECHPDRGGTNEAMAKVNAAFELLMEGTP